MDLPALTLVAAVASITIVTLAVIYRPLLLESIDPLFLKAVNGKGGLWHLIFLVLVVMNLVSGFQALGTLMAVGLMMIPAITARLWVRGMGGQILLAVLFASCAGCSDCCFPIMWKSPPPSIILFCGGWYAFSVLFGSEGGLLAKWLRGSRHKTF
ncbi:ABC 3 transport family [Kingella potus]|uniref:ABC 3 transport family n=1 Tax=Kingella potus TaxID=265175 RepID=A0A377R3T3_9NEIS|nr:ABC 3 transport family [Kingella potus]